MNLEKLIEWEQVSPLFRGQGKTEQVGIIRKFKGGLPNRFKIETLAYEQTDGRCREGEMIPTGWRRYQCHCGDAFWSRETAEKVQGCERCLQKEQPKQKQAAGAEDGQPYGRPRLQLTGLQSGSITVTGHVKGKGWKVECRCGRTKYIIGGTAIQRGMHKTCGQCTEEERRAAAPLDAHSSGLRPSEFAQNKIGDTALRLPIDLEVCAADHPRITYDRSESADGCPLCMALAQVELAGSNPVSK